MGFFLGSLLIQLDYTDPEVADHLEPLFHGWPHDTYVNPELLATDVAQSRKPGCIFRLEIVEHTPEVPEGEPIFQEKSHLLPSTIGFVSIYRQGEQKTIYFYDGALIQLSPDAIHGEGVPLIVAKISRRLLHSGRLEDVLFAGLAPFLRRRGYFLVHAFAVTRYGHSVLLIGPSNSGKTTTGLGLTTAGWGYLANDVVLLKLLDNEVYAFPTPGAIGLSARTIKLIPRLDDILKWMPEREFAGKRYLPALGLVDSWAEPAPVRTICFPNIQDQQAAELRPVRKALTLAKLMESSTDRWDQVMLEDHFNLLQRLVEQADGYDLTIGDQVAGWSESLPEFWN